MSIAKDKLIIFPSVDKKYNEVWTDNRSPINIPRPYRMVIIAPCNGGKSSLVKNIILKAKPEYSKIYVWANSASREWQDYCDEILTTQDLIDDPERFMSFDDVDDDILDEKKKYKKQRLLIIEDVELIHVSKALKDIINRLFKHVSSHYNLTIIVNVQNYNMVPIDIRNVINVFCINLNLKDIESISILGKRIGYGYSQFKQLFQHYRDTVENRQYKYLVIDNTSGTKNPLSIDFFQKIDIV